MRNLSDADIVAVWEAGVFQHPLDRPLTLLAAVSGQTRSDLASVPVGQRDRRLWELHQQVFGQELAGVIPCPQCGQQVELKFLVGDALRGEINPPAEGSLNMARWSVSFRLPDSRDLAAIAGHCDVEQASAELLRRCVLRAACGGEDVEASDLPTDVVAAVEQRMSQLDPQAEVCLELSCSACERRWQNAFDIANFVWSEVAARVKRVMRDVDLLARTYGWSEAEVLALSPFRRQSYAELAGA